MNPTIWGPEAWTFLHTITISYPDNPTKEEKASAKKLIESLAYLLPCVHCKSNFAKHIKNISDDVFSSRKKFFEWLVDVHNNVNRQKGTREYSYKEVLSAYKKKFNHKNNYQWIFVLIFVIIITILVIQERRKF